tara:strand:- start:391 stop:753 length:363 start_codon:yes stop_codon:yes gene_type:complete
MPSQRKRIGFLPSEEVHDIIEKLCRDNEFSQSKITGLLVEEALRSRGVLKDSSSLNHLNDSNFINYYFEDKLLSKNKKPVNIDDNSVNKKTFSDDIRMMHEFIEYKYFKKVMKQNKDILE